MTTKERILAAALELFNESNTQAATTNHIAAALGMSPGNLHYHYSNREAIIYALYEQMLAKTVLPPSEFPATMTAIHRHQLHLAGVYWEYRFFHRELLFLLSRDPELRTRYVRENREHAQRVRAVLEGLTGNGYLELPCDNVYDQLTDTILLCNQFWLSHLETLGIDVDAENLSGGFRHIEGAMRPYLTQKALKELADIGA